MSCPSSIAATDLPTCVQRARCKRTKGKRCPRPCPSTMVIVDSADARYSALLDRVLGDKDSPVEATAACLHCRRATTTRRGVRFEQAIMAEYLHDLRHTLDATFHATAVRTTVIIANVLNHEAENEPELWTLGGFLIGYVYKFGTGVNPYTAPIFYTDLVCSMGKKGTALLRRAEEYAHTQGIFTMALRAATPTLFPYYQKQGYSRCGLPHLGSAEARLQVSEQMDFMWGTNEDRQYGFWMAKFTCRQRAKERRINKTLQDLLEAHEQRNKAYRRPHINQFITERDGTGTPHRGASNQARRQLAQVVHRTEKRWKACLGIIQDICVAYKHEARVPWLYVPEIARPPEVREDFVRHRGTLLYHQYRKSKALAPETRKAATYLYANNVVTRRQMHALRDKVGEQYVAKAKAFNEGKRKFVKHVMRNTHRMLMHQPIQKGGH